MPVMEASDHISMLLRVALLESLTLGQAQPTQWQAPKLPLSTSSLLLRAQHADAHFQQSIERYKTIVQFVGEYNVNKAYLQPTGLLPSSNAVVSSNGVSHPDDNGTRPNEQLGSSLLSTQSIISLLLDAEQDLKQLDRDLRMCEEHQEKNTAGAGKLAEYRALVPRLDTLQTQASAHLNEEIMLENRVVQLLERYNGQVDAISKLFLHWDQGLSQCEDALTHLERSHR